MKTKLAIWLTVIIVGVLTGLVMSYASDTCGWNRPVCSVLNTYYSVTSVNNSLTLTGDLNITGNLIVSGNISLKRPHGMWSDNTTQVVLSTGTPYDMNFSQIELQYLINRTAKKTNFTFQQRGVYLVELSIMGQSSVASTHLEIWAKKNGKDIPRSNTRYEFKSVNAEAVLAVPFIVDMEKGENLSIAYAGDNNGVILPATPITAYSPSTPSSIVTISKVSDLT